MTSTPHRWPRAVAGAASCLVLIATGIGAVGAYFANDIVGNIQISSDGNFTPPPVEAGGPKSGAPINILLMGSDTREGSNAKGHGNAQEISGARSDTTIMVHISSDRTRAMAVSIPRDSRVTLPVCKTSTGTRAGGYVAQFNEAFDIGGPGCTVKAVEELTGVSINHYVVVDFTGFKNVVNALDGVEVCLNRAVFDPLSKLDLPAGKSVVKGEQALAFVRARKTIGDGSDTQRIQRQQDFLSSAIRKATSTGILTNPPKLFEVLSAGTKSLTTDPELANITALKDLAVNVSAVEPGKIVFATVPTISNDDMVTVSWIPSQAKQLWTAMKTDAEWPPAATKGLDDQPLYAAPAEIRVNVLNGTSIDGNAQRAAGVLEREGYNVIQIGGTKQRPLESLIEYNAKIPAQVEAARTLAYGTGAILKPVKAPGNAVTLIAGVDFPASVKPVTTTREPNSPAAAAKPRTAAESTCSG